MVEDTHLVDDRVEWLVRYVRGLSDDLSKAATGSGSDMSQDCIKVVRHEQRFRAFLTGRDEDVVPITFEMWPSLSCDARCALCTYSLNKARTEADKSTDLRVASGEVMKSVLKELAANGVCSVIWTGGGEPTLHPDLPKLVRSGRAAGLEWGLFTHGVHLKPELADALLEAGPRFLRVSVNAGSADWHNREYRLGRETYGIIKENVIQAARLTAGGRRCVGLGYAMGDKTEDEELDGIKAFVSEIFERSGGALGFVSFRPKVIFYKNNVPVLKQPGCERLGDLVERIHYRIVQPLRAQCGNALRIDFKAGMFLRLAELTPPKPSLASGWSGAMDHLGNGYILSELNGSPWPGACYGSFAGHAFQEVWRGEQRIQLARKYARGEILAAAHHKMSHVDDMLRIIRAEIGILSAAQAGAFFRQIANEPIHWPPNWDFL